jgi:hypothetical protein
MMIENNELLKIIEFGKSATPGPWKLHEYADAHVIGTEDRPVANCGGYQSNRDVVGTRKENENNAAYVISACNSAPAMAEEIIRLREAVDAALSEAVKAIYFDDNSDYGTYLWGVIRALGGDEAANLLENDVEAAWYKYTNTGKEAQKGGSNE